MTEFRAVEILGTQFPVLVAPGIIAMSPSAWATEHDGLDIEIMVVALPAEGGSAGRPICTALKISRLADGPSITPEVLRKVPVTALIRFAARMSLRYIDESTGRTLGASDRRMTDDLADRLRAEGPTDRTLKWVADIYRTATVLSVPPTKSVQDELELPRSTAGSWVALAREKGFLGRSEGRGRAGG